MFKRGSIYSARLYPSKGHEVGKNIPVLVLQTDLLNEIEHTTLIVLPLTTSLVENSYPLRYRIDSRENLKQTSEILCDQLRAIDVNRLDSNKIASLTQIELLELQEQIEIILEF